MMDEVCTGCGHCEQCVALRQAAAAGAQPEGVPIRVYGGYLEARAALRANAPAVATRVLQWLLSHLAEERGAPKEQSLSQKLRKLTDEQVITERVRDALADRALTPGAEQAWALMSLVEHAFYRLYLREHRRA